MELLQQVLNMLRQQERGVLVTVIDASAVLSDWVGGHWIWRENWDNMLTSDHGESVQGCQTDQLWSNEMEQVFNLVCEQVLADNEFRRERVTLGQQWLDLMLEPIVPMPRLLILGCGHVGQALAQMAEWLGWPITVVDDRPDFAHPGRFPSGAQVLCGDFTQVIHSVNPLASDYVVIVTRGHQYDRICLETLAGRPLAYLGMIGSRRRVRGLMEELARNGVDEQWLHSVHSPIGLEIGAETPEEIAVSIVAEMIQVRRKGGTR